MKKIEFEKKMLVKLIRTDLGFVWDSDDFQKEDLMMILKYFLEKTKALSD